MVEFERLLSGEAKDGRRSVIFPPAPRPNEFEYKRSFYERHQIDPTQRSHHTSHKSTIAHNNRDNRQFSHDREEKHKKLFQ